MTPGPLDEVRRQIGLGIVTEVMDPRLVEQTADHADMPQIGSRFMQNFPLLTVVGRRSIPVLLERGWSATLEDWLCAAEYIAKEGNRNIVLCERGIRASCHWSYAHNVLDLNVIEPLLSRDGELDAGGHDEPGSIVGRSPRIVGRSARRRRRS